MKSIIVGGGKVGYNLLKKLIYDKQNAILVEKNRDICYKIAESMDAKVILGDGTDIDVLEEAGIRKADIIAAVTDSDECNFVVCQIAKTNFNVNKTIARVNNPNNIETFKAFGIDNIICSAEEIGELIEKA